MDKEYIERLKDMLADADAKIASVEDIQDPTEREVKKSMFLESRKEIEALLKKAGGSAKKPAKKASTKSVSTKKKAAPKKAAKKPVVKKKPAKKASVKKTTKKVTKKPAKKASAKKASKPKAKKAVAKKPAAKKTTKKVAKKSAPKKAKKSAAKKATKKAAKKSAAKKSSKDTTVRQFTAKPKKKSVKKVSKKSSTSDDAKAVFSNTSKKDLKKVKKESVKEKKASQKKAKQTKKVQKKSNSSQKKLVKETAKSKKEAKADFNADATVYMKPKKETTNNSVDKNLESAVDTFGNDKNESKIDKREDKTTEKEFKKAKKWEKKEAKLEAKEEQPLKEAKVAPAKETISAADKKSIKEANKRAKEAKKLEKKQAKEYKKQAKVASKEIKKTKTINGYEIPEYSDEISKVRSTNVSEFGTSHPEMTEKELALNTIYASLFYADSDAKYNKDLEDHKPISVGSYEDSNYEGAIQPYKDIKSTPTAKVGVEAGPLTNGPVAIPNDAADKVNPNGNATEPVQEAKPVEEKKTVKASKEEPAKPVEEKVEEPISTTTASEESKVEAKPVKAEKVSADEKEAIKAANKKAKEQAKAEKEAEKEYKKQEKKAKKAIKKPTNVNGILIPEYSDNIDKIRSKSVPEFETTHPAMTDEQLILNTEYASLFYADSDAKYNKDLEDHKPISVGVYDDKNYDDAIQPYKDTKSTPTAKVGVEAGPLTNGPVAIPDDAADKANPNGNVTEPVQEAKPVEEKKTVKVEEAKPVEPAEEKVEEPSTNSEDKKEAEKQAKAKAAADAKAAKEAAKAKAKADKEAAKEAKIREKEAEKQKAAQATPITEAVSQPEQTVDPKEAKKLAKKQAKEAKKQAKAEAKLAKKQQQEELERETEMKRKLEEDKFRQAKVEADKKAKKQQEETEKQKEKEAEINRLAAEASEKAAKQQKEDEEKAAKEAKESSKSKKELAVEAKEEKESAEETDKRIAEQSSKRAEIKKGEYIKVDLPPILDEGVKSLKQIAKRQKQLTSKYSKQILEGAIVTTTDYKPDVSKHVIELHDVVKSYITGDIETPVLKGVNLKLNKGDFIVILGPSGSGKTTFLNTISGLDKATKGDVFVLGYNLSYLKDSHLTKFRRKHVGFIFQQYNLLTNLTAKENAEVGENLSAYKNPDMTIEDIFETIGMKTQMNKYPHQMSGGQQQRVSIARALAKNPDILFADEPTGALDEEMGRKVLEILVEVNKRYGTTVIVVTHNPNIAKIGNTVIHIRNGKVEEVEANQKPADPSKIEWA